MKRFPPKFRRFLSKPDFHQTQISQRKSTQTVSSSKISIFRDVSNPRLPSFGVQFCQRRILGVWGLQVDRESWGAALVEVSVQELVLQPDSRFAFEIIVSRLLHRQLLDLLLAVDLRTRWSHLWVLSCLQRWKLRAADLLESNVQSHVTWSPTQSSLRWISSEHRCKLLPALRVHQLPLLVHHQLARPHRRHRSIGVHHLVIAARQPQESQVEAADRNHVPCSTFRSHSACHADDARVCWKAVKVDEIKNIRLRKTTFVSLFSGRQTCRWQIKRKNRKNGSLKLPQHLLRNDNF